MCAATIGHTSRKTICPFCRKTSSCGSRPPSSRTVEEPEVVADVVRELRGQLRADDRPDVVGHGVGGPFEHDAVHASPKMKWKSRSSKLLWPDVISGLTTTTHDADPLRSASTAAWIENVAEQHATFMSYAQPDGAERVLDLDGHRRVGALQVRAADDHGVDVGTGRDRPGRAPARSPASPSRPARRAGPRSAPRGAAASGRGRGHPTLSTTWRDLIPDALTMNSSFGNGRAASEPASISAACSSLNRVEATVSDSTSSAFDTTSAGAHRPVPVIETSSVIAVTAMSRR